MSAVTTGSDVATGFDGGRKNLWYKDAVIYQLHVRSFCDTNGDGIGDFRGLTSKLDYVQDLGVTAIWLLPFYPSPLKDEGYDIADYTSVNPAYGTLADFQEFLVEAHRRGLKVITELVINHTSDQHPWFQLARRAPPGSRERDFYVWTDDPHRYREARIIFQDFEHSNWTWDPLAKAYYWHRFYAHQPDLNYDNPAVHEAIFQVVDFWMELGVDGMRLDAVPYLYEREGTNCENLPETHEFLRRLRRHIDERYRERMLLAEANQWPEDAAAYFGAGDECHMNFNFPLMTRLFIAIHHEDSFPVVDIMRQTPPIPENCQWGIFLRNHDELTLEMVTDEERDGMYKAYAADPRARVDLGIRRRLAPLLKNNRRKMELMNGLLMSLPGSPILYYGDEIEMGDNIYLPDRDSVRTPMQWSPDRNAGFSAANPQRLFLPPIIDPEYHYATSNVETQVNSPHSLLWWTRRLVRLRRRHPAFARGSIEFLPAENHRILAFLREYAGETILVVANLSRFAQCVELDLARFRGRTPVEMFGGTRFPLVGELPYFLTLGPHGFLWFRLEWPAGEEDRRAPATLPALEVDADWSELLATPQARLDLAALVPKYLARQWWYVTAARTIREAEIFDWIELTAHDSDATRFRLLLVRVSFADGEPDICLLPLFYAAGKRAEGLLADRPTAGLCQVHARADGATGFVCDATAEREMWAELAQWIAREQTLKSSAGTVRGRTIGERALPDIAGTFEPAVNKKLQRNMSAQFGERFMLKMYRRLVEGTNPELEIGRRLALVAPEAPTPALRGWLEWTSTSGGDATLAVMHDYQPHQSDGWTHALDEIGRFCETVTAEFAQLDPAATAVGGANVWDRATQHPPELAVQTIGDYLATAELLGRRTAQMHRALGAGSAGTTPPDPAFEPVPFNKLYQRSLYQTLRTTAVRNLELLARQRGRLGGEVRAACDAALAAEAPYLERLHWILTAELSGKRIRCHGDYNLRQVLFTGNDFRVIDFEGETERTLADRRLKRSPLRDVAGMIRSLLYASHGAEVGLVPGLSADNGHFHTQAGLRSWLSFWFRWSSAAFVRGYQETIAETGLVSLDPMESGPLLEILVIEALVYDLGFELVNRPECVRTPLVALADAMSAMTGGAGP